MGFEDSFGMMPGMGSMPGSGMMPGFGMMPDSGSGMMPGFGSGTTPDFGSGPAVGSAEGLFGILIAVYFAIVGIALIFGVVSYILGAVGLCGIAKRRGIRCAGLAWLPVGNAWILGSISDQYQYVVKGKVCNRRKKLLGLNIAVMVLAFFVGSLSGVTGGMTAEMVTTNVADPMILLAIAIALLVFAVAFLVVSIINTVQTYIAYYHLFFSCTPDDAVLFLVLGILFSVTLPFFVFGLRKRDNGMPPRKTAPVIE